jgi:hypothetical protein
LFLIAPFWPLLWSWLSFCVPSCTLLAMVMVVLLCSWLPPLAHGHGPPLLFLIAFLLAIIMSSCVFYCAPPNHYRGRLFVFLVASFKPSLWSSSCFPGCVHHSHYHGHGHVFMFLVVFLLAITMSWSSFCVPSCSPLGHRCGHPFMFMVAFLLAIVVVMVIFFCSWLHSSWPL